MLFDYARIWIRCVIGVLLGTLTEIRLSCTTSTDVLMDLLGYSGTSHEALFVGVFRLRRSTFLDQITSIEILAGGQRISGSSLEVG